MTTRRGLMMSEVVVASALLSGLLALCLQLVSATAVQRRAIDQRRCALVELGNVMERVASRPWAELTTSAAAAERLSSWAGAQLPGAELKIQLSTSDAEREAKRITATLAWTDSGGQRVTPLQLTTWKYASGKK